MFHRSCFTLIPILFFVCWCQQAQAQQTPVASTPPPLPCTQPADLSTQLAELFAHEDELMQLRSRQRIGGPIVVIATASVIASFFAIGTLSTALSLPEMKRAIDNGSYDESNDMNDDGVIDKADLRILRRLTAGFGTVTAVHLGVVALGNWWLFKRLTTRQRVNRELRGVHAKRKVLKLQMGLQATNTSAHGFIGGSF